MSNKKPARKKKMSAKNIAAGFLMALLALSLLGFGVEGFGSGTRHVVSVDDRKIDANDYARALRNEMAAFESQIGQPLTLEQARLFGLDRMVLEQLITGAVLQNEAARLGVSVGDRTVQSEILRVSAFTDLGGQFDREAYRFALQNIGMSEAQFETSIREDIARTILQLSVVSGAAAPEAAIAPLLDFQAQTRDFSVIALSAADLDAPIGQPDEAVLQAYYEDQIARYTRPAGTRIHYVKLTPEMMIDTLDVDEDQLRQAYAARAAEFQRPERRLVERLVFADQASAEAAMGRLRAGETDFEALVAERGLSLDDTDMGDVTRAQLGAAAEAVFALSEPDVIGPVETNLGPAIFRMNAILSALETPFEDVRDELRDEALADRARRALLDDLDMFEDLLAGGASLRELANETAMEFGEIDWRGDARDGIAAYESFRLAANALQEGDFAEINLLEDGGLFALEFARALPPEPIALDEIRIQVINDWRLQQTTQALRARADSLTAALSAGEAAETLGVVPVVFEGMTRTDFLPDLPRALMTDVFEMAPDSRRVIEVEGQVFVLELHAIASADMLQDNVAQMRDVITQQLEQSYAQDLFTYFSSALRDTSSIRVEQAVIAAVQANF